MYFVSGGRTCCILRLSFKKQNRIGIKGIRGIRFYGSLFLLTLVCVGLASIIIFVALSQEPIDYEMICFAPLFLLILVYAIVRYAINTPIIRLNDEGIMYARQRHGWGEVTSVDYIGQKRFPMFGGGSPLGAMTLYFENGTELCIFDTMYHNGNEIRQYVASRVHQKQQTPLVVDEPNAPPKNIPNTKKGKPEFQVDLSDAKCQNTTFYKGSLFLCIPGIMSWGIVTVVLLILYGVALTPFVLVFLLLFCLLFILLSYTLNYFGVSQDYLVVKNQHLVWRHKAFKFSDISEVLLTCDRGNAFITISFTDFRHTRFQGASLKNENWLALKNALTEIDVNVKDTVGYDNLIKPETKHRMRKVTIWFLVQILVFTVVAVPISYMPTDTTSQTLLKDGLLIALVAASIFVNIRIISLAKRESEEEKRS